MRESKGEMEELTKSLETVRPCYKTLQNFDTSCFHGWEHQFQAQETLENSSFHYFLTEDTTCTFTSH